jgi:hypothetical protein
MYFSPIEYLGVKVSVIVQVVLFVYLSAILVWKNRLHSDFFANISLLQAFKVFMNTYVIQDLATFIADFIKFTQLPTVYLYTKNILRKDTADKLLVFISVSVLVSAIPYLMGIIKPVTEAYDIAVYGGEGSMAYIGFFQHPHSAAVSLSFSLLYLINNVFINKKYSRLALIIFIPLIALGVFALYKTYVRTGYLMFGAAVILLYIKTFKIKFVAIYIAIAMLAVVGVKYLLTKDIVLQNRLSDKTIYMKGDAGVERKGAGRIIFVEKAIEIWSESNIIEKFFGVGNDEMRNRMHNKTRMFIPTHNGFTDALLVNGLIGFIIFILYLYSIFNMINLNRKSSDYLIAMSFFIQYLFFQFTQGGVFFIPEIMMGLCFGGINLSDNKEDE